MHLAEAPDESQTSPSLSALTVTSTTHDDVVLVALAGQLDIYTTPGFREQVRPYDPAKVQLVIDLTEVRLIDSAGLGALLILRNAAHRAGARMALICPHRHLTRLFWATGARPAFVFGDDLVAVRDALGALRPRIAGAAAGIGDTRPVGSDPTPATQATDDEPRHAGGSRTRSKRGA